MYPKNRIPMYEGDGFIHPSPIRDAAENSFVQAPKQDSGLRVERGPGLSGAARELLHKLAVWIGVSVRHPRGKPLEN
jgi:hypothetical protein